VRRFGWLNAVHVPVYLGSLAVLPILVWFSGMRVRRPAAALALFVFFALLCNVAICGVLASPYDRYQRRLAFLAPLAVGMAAFGWRRTKRRIDDL
jgi:peptidoglycan/LPS O-acetylase OafA/YrhL